jgi:chemotaxis family two-component system sensor kinase Cph1
MSTAVPAADLSNCDREPIHIPGSIQPHGALLAFMPDGGLALRSANAGAMLGELPAPGERLDERHLSALMRAEIGSALQAFDSVLGSLSAELHKRCFDVIMHQADGLLVVEFEEREAATDKLETFALRAQKSIARIQRQRSIEQLLAVAVEEIARLSGFDRVMAYRFLHDDSGEVVAEHRRADLLPYLGQRYPASDIPRQARRLYVLNPIRLIADVGYQPVPLVPEIAPHTRAPLDLSESMLRSVSPVHVEYLRNMGVAASMSISIVVKGRLWGLFACHHTTPYLVPHAVRMSCQVLSQIVGMLVDRNLTAQHAAALQRSLALRDVILQQFERNDDIVLALAENPTPFRQLLSCDGVAASAEGALHISGAGPEREALGALIEWLAETDQPDIFHTASLDRDAPQLAERFGAICGVLALRFDREQKGYAFWFRNEQVMDVRWAGPPHKEMAHGPLGPRLTPRGSFEEWKETVRGQSLPWTRTDIDIAFALRGGLQEGSMSKASALRRAREMLMATLGHDLRDPLQAIMIAAQMLDLNSGSGGVHNRLSQRITSSSGRMQRLIDQMVDISSLQGGLGLPVSMREVALGPLLAEVTEEIRLAQPGVELHARHDGLGTVRVDPDRISQVVSNLVSNSCKHGVPGTPVLLEGRRLDDAVVITVSNRGAPLAPDLVETLFLPYKPGSLNNSRNRGGQGLGLYIVHEIVKAHGGEIGVRCAGGMVVFEVCLPQSGTQARRAAA